MSYLPNSVIVTWLVLLVDWSLRWSIVLAVLALCFALRPPRRAAIRHALCTAGLAAGLMIPVVPRWAGATITWPSAMARPALAPSPRQQRGPEILTASTVERAAAPRPGEPTAKSESPLRSVHAADPVRAALAWIQALGRDVWQLTSLILAVIWVMSFIIFSGHFFGGWLFLARLRRGASKLSEASIALMDECRQAVRLSRPTELAFHPAVASPVTLGGLRPLVLVPPDWDAWPESHRRACLLHELAHLARYDDWAKLVEELVRIPFFFHPLVLWLLARLERERELLCDEAVVALGADPVAYARLLLDLARCPARLVTCSFSIRMTCLPFLDRGTVAVRIDRLLEVDMSRTLCPTSPPRLFVVGAAAFAVALGLGSFRVRAVESQNSKLDHALPTGTELKHEKNQPETAKSDPVRPSSRTIKGRVIDSDGKSVAGAVVVVGLRDAGALNHQVVITDKDGLFLWQVAPGGSSLSVVAHKPGWAAASTDYWIDTEERAKDIDIQLGKPEPFTAVLVDKDQRPVAGANVRVEMSADGGTSTDAPGRSTTWTAYTYYLREVITGSPLESLFVTTTDDRGSFSFRSFPHDHRLRLAVTTRDGREMRIKTLPRSEAFLDRNMAGEGFVSGPVGQETRLTILPAASVQGRVTTKLPDVSVAGIKVSFTGSRVQQDRYSPTSNFTGIARTEPDGRFVFDGLNEGTVNIWIMEDQKDPPWTYRAAEHVQLRSGTTTTALIELIRGVEVEGKVIVQGTGLPVKGVRIGVKGALSPWSHAMDSSGTTGGDGRYHYRLPPGETSFYPLDDLPAYVRASENDPSQTVRIPDGVTRFEVPPIVLVSKTNQTGP